MTNNDASWQYHTWKENKGESAITTKPDCVATWIHLFKLVNDNWSGNINKILSFLSGCI